MRRDSPLFLSPRPASPLDNVPDSKPGPPVVVLNRIAMLEMMVCDLEKMNTALREKDSPPPTPKEQCIIGLICGHVELDIFLAQRESNSKFLALCDDAEFKLEELRKGLEKTGLPFWDLNWEFNSVEGTDGNPYGSLANCMIHELCNGWYDTYESLYNAGSSKKCHHQVHDLVDAEITMPSDMEIEGVGQKSQNKAEGLSSYTNGWSIIKDDDMVSGDNSVVPSQKLSDSTHEESLINILQRLEYMRLMRAYAPPSNNELKCYREIRKWINSAISYIMAKTNDQCVRYRCTGTRGWSSLFSDLLSPFTHIPATPKGHKLAVALDKLPEFLLLLRSCKERLLEICSNSTSKKGASDAMDCMDGTITQDCEVKKKRKHDTDIRKHDTDIKRNGNIKREKYSCISETGSDETSTSIREKTLLKILSLFLRIESLCMDECPTIQEVRLYAQVLEHVYLSIWMFKGFKYSVNSVNDEEYYVLDSVKNVKYRTSTNIELGNSSNQVHYLSELSESLVIASDQMWKKEWTRLQYLEEAVYLVETIKASYTCIPPTAREMVLYSELKKHLREDFLQSGCNWKHGSPDDAKGASEREGTPEEVALLKHMLKVIYDKEIEILKVIGEEREDVEKAVHGLKEEGFDDTCPEEWNFLCRILLVIDEVNELFTIFTLALDDANEYLDYLMYSTESRSYSCVACEVHNALIAISQLDC